ncbi:MAG TPA: Gfo/Idh/MocA family oxidoreductase [Candidatus Dormibacteraeota bacterium]|nr:Gfo/Idh/MocA family oxidoreductase [Candidatus Dormibacteraeota bacterium]
MGSEGLRFGIVGTGAIAKSYEAAFRGLETARLAGACDVDPTAVWEFSQRVGCEPYASYQEMAGRADLDAVIICTPPHTHEEITTYFLNRRVAVLCEKPLTISVPSAHRILEAAKRSGAVFTMASKFRYVDDVQRAWELVHDHTIGDVVLIENAFTSRVDMSKRWNGDSKRSGGGVLIDNGTHSVDILRYFLGTLVDVQIFEAKRIQGLGVEDTIHLFVRSEQGVTGTTDLSWSIDKELDTYLRIYGSRGTILVGWKESRYRLSGETEWNVFGNGYDKVRAFRNQIENFSDAILGRGELRITPYDALASVEVINAAYAALQRSHWESIRGSLGEIGTRSTAALRVS